MSEVSGLPNEGELSMAAAYAANDAYDYAEAAGKMLELTMRYPTLPADLVSLRAVQQEAYAMFRQSIDRVGVFPDFTQTSDVRDETSEDIDGLGAQADRLSQRLTEAEVIDPLSIPKRYNSAEDVIADPEVFPDLQEDLREKAIRAFSMFQIIEGKIADGVLPEVHRMPPLTTFGDSLAQLTETYEAMKKHGWEPEIVYVPMGLSFDQSRKLFKGTFGKATADGIDRMHGEQENTAKPYTGPRWGAAVISGAEYPVLSDVSADGRFGAKARQAFDLLRNLPTAGADAKAEVLARQFSPPTSAYLALQILRLDRGDIAVDQGTITYGDEDVRIGDETTGRTEIRTMQFASRNRTLIYHSVNPVTAKGGIRPCVVVPNEYSNPDVETL